MRLGFTGDFHLGFGVGRRKGEAARQAERAMRVLKRQKVDLVVNTGDIFDTVVPRPEALRDAASIFGLFRPKLRLRGVNRPDSENGMIAIHGNHERRIRGEVNPVKLLEHLGLVTYLHNSGVVADGAELFGVGSVPETYAPKVFRGLQVRPTTSNPSFFVFHQNVRPYIPTKDSLEFSDLPAGFNYYVDGHIHTPRLEKNFLITGSTVMTSLAKSEAEKFVWVWEDGQFEKFTFKTRPFIHIAVDAGGMDPKDIVKKVKHQIEETLSQDFDEEPLVRVVVHGRLAEGFRPSDLMLRGEYEGAAVYFDKKLQGSSAAEGMGLESMDINSITVDAFKKVLGSRNLKVDASQLYAFLMAENWDGIWGLLMEAGK